MKLGTLKDGTRDGQLLVVSRDLRHAASGVGVAPSLREALENWAVAGPRLQQLADQLEAGGAPGRMELDVRRLAAPLPRAAQWLDASTFHSHSDLLDRVFKSDPVPDKRTVPMMYQGASDDFLGACDDVPLPSEADDIDFEAEVAVVVDDVDMGTDAAHALGHVKLLMLVNDVSLRALVPRELRTGYGFLQAKPSSGFAPVAVTPDELGPDWDGARLNRPLLVELNGAPFGKAEAGIDMTFDFPTLIAHAAKTRNLRAGTILGSGTVSNRGPDGGPGRPIAQGGVGYSCIAEQRMVETILEGQPRTPFLRAGDRVTIEMEDRAGRSIFGAIDQTVAPPPR